MPLSLVQMFLDAQARAKAAPGDLNARGTLWQIFAARGELDRARAQLDTMLRIDASWAMEVQGCHALLDAEKRRSAVFAGQEAPSCLGEPSRWFGALVSALPLLADGQREAAGQLLLRARDEAETCTGTLNGGLFQWICDADARLGTYLEVVAQGRYVWVEFRLVRRLICMPPQELRDLIWQPGKLELDDVGVLDVFLPVRYPGAATDEHMLARHTDWEPLADDLFLGHGQKSLSTDLDVFGLLDLRELCVDSPS